MCALQLYALLIIVPLSVTGLSLVPILDPCGEWLQTNECPADQECQLVRVDCVRAPCPPLPMCVHRSLKVSSCRYGDPVLDSNYKALWCSDVRPCPDNTTCNYEVQDVQTTCCWQPNEVQPSPPYDPCIAATCLVGHRCEARKPKTCFNPPCQLQAVCIPPNEMTTVDPQNTCAVVLCKEGYHCEMLATPCAPSNPPRPCPLQPVCLKDPVVDKPGSCPVASGFGICLQECETDGDCDGSKKCCSNGCGNVCTDPAGLPTTTTAPVIYPCATVKCSAGQECRLQQVDCVTQPCPPLPVCVREIPKPSTPQCQVGLPVINSNNVGIFCGRGPSRQDCPDSTYCETDPLDRFAVCCHQSNLPESPCALIDCAPGFICKEIVNPCLIPPCPTRGECVASKKPGVCPVLEFDPSCRKDCFDDVDCPGQNKCCKDGCGKKCVNPDAVTTTPLPLTSYPCSEKKCSSGFECRMKEVVCFRASCELQPTCIPETPKLSERRCPVGYPAVDMNNEEFFCGRGPNRRSCPSGTYCNIHPTDRFAVCCYNTDEGTTTLPPKPVTKEGTCPSTVGLIGTCDEACSGDSSCPGTQKCCSNGCGHTCQEPPTTTTYAASDPCSKKKCRRNRVCQLQKVRCIRSPCPPVARCVASSRVSGSNSCKSGYPVLNLRRRQISCRASTAVCPDSTVCSNGVCCWNTDTPTRPLVPAETTTTTTPKPPKCPRRLSFMYFFCKFFYATCSNTSHCNSGTVCCQGCCVPTEDKMR